MIALAILSTGCASRPSERPITGYAYVGPATLNLRKDLGPRAPAVGTAKHGDKLEVLETRRRFVRVRTADKAEGWTDGNLLLTQQQMDDLNLLAAQTAKLPSQGAGTVYDALNVHTQPNRQSTSFSQIAEGGSFEVLDHRVTAHDAPAPPPKPTIVKRAAAETKPKAKTASTVSALPAPPTPAPPPNWEDLSHPRASDLPGYAPRFHNPAPPISGGDDWYLVRTRDGRAGWVLARMVSMSIPDDVAQYAEGHRITAYVSLGAVTATSNGETKNDWLWTTISSNLTPCDFDSFRVFVWSKTRRHYETAFIERNVQGYYPVEAVVRPGQDEKAFSIVIEEKDGRRYKRTYAFSGYHVRLVSKVPAEARPALPEVRAAHNFDESTVPAAPEMPWRDRLRQWRERLFNK